MAPFFWFRTRITAKVCFKAFFEGFGLAIGLGVVGVTTLFFFFFLYKNFHKH